MVKRIAKVVGLVAGVAAVVWAMRDRFVSVAISREPRPPAFRRPPEPGPVEPVDAIEGIGPVFAQRLSGAGIDSVARLATSSPDSVAEAAGVSGSRARSWIEQARSRG